MKLQNDYNLPEFTGRNAPDIRRKFHAYSRELAKSRSNLLRVLHCGLKQKKRQALNAQAAQESGPNFMNAEAQSRILQLIKRVETQISRLQNQYARLLNRHEKYFQLVG